MTILAPGWTKITPYVFQPSEGKAVGYIPYRKRTGQCELCGVSMSDHPKCDACGALSGIPHWIHSNPYRGHNLCGYCMKAWERVERINGHVTWEEFLTPKYYLKKVGVN